MNILIRIVFLLCIPSILLHSIPYGSTKENVYYLEDGSKLFIPRDEEGLIDPFAYFKPETILTRIDGYINHVFGFIDLLTDENFLSHLSDEEADRLIDFVIYIVRFSVPKSRPDLKEKYEKEISELLELMYGDDDNEEENDYKLLSDCHFSDALIPAIAYEKPDSSNRN